MTGRALIHFTAVAAPAVLAIVLVGWFAAETLIERWLDRAERDEAEAIR